MSRLKTEIAQQKPFSSRTEEALLNTLRTADCLHRAGQLALRSWNITSSQYNVLRILRGAHPEGLPCSAIGDRMITAEPDITRLLSRLKARQLIRQQRSRKDRRVLWTYISDSGLALLEEMDETVARLPDRLLGHLSEHELSEFIRLLELARMKCGDGRQPPTCEGNDGAVTCPPSS